MRVVQNLGFILLSSWLILSALFSLLNINWPISSVVLSLLAIAAGILVLLSVVVGPSVPIGGLGTPQQYIGTE